MTHRPPLDDKIRRRVRGERVVEAQSGILRCPSCGHGNRPEPPRERILAPQSALEGERKHVTVLFADVEGSMELAAQLDPEDWHRILDRFLTILAEGGHRFESRTR